MTTKIKNWIKDKWKKILSVFVISTALAAGGTILQDQTKNEVSLEKLNSKYEQSVEIKAKYQLDNASLVKTDIKNPELDKYKGEPKDEIKITLGDSLTEFTPAITLARWRETSFKIKPKGLESVATKDKDLTFEGDKIKFKTPKMDFEMVDVPATANDEGGYKYIWYLNEKPLTNKIEFQIESSGLDFFRQPPLTEEYQNGYSEQFQKEIIVSETQVKDLDGNVLVERPENVVGSYTVYHSTKGGMNDINGKEYKTGKAFHIYRPRIIDASGAETWGNLLISDGIYSITIPQDFLDTAVYPIKSNDTFGYETAGNSSWGLGNYIIGTPYPMDSQNGTADQKITASMYNGVSSQNIKLAIYDGNTLKGYTVERNPDTNQTKHWEDFNMDSSADLTADTTYGLVHWMSASNIDYFYYDSGGAGRYDPETYGANFPATAAFGDLGDYKFSIYATYTPSGGGAPAPERRVIIIE